MTDNDRLPLNDDERRRLEQYDAEAERKRAEELEKQEKRRVERQRLAEAAVLPGKRLWLLFWLIIPNIILGIIGGDEGLLSEICDMIKAALEAGVLISMMSIDTNYGRAGLCGFVSAAIGAFANIGLSGVNTPVQMFVLCVALVPGVLAIYLEYNAHAQLMTNYDCALADRWLGLWKWTAGSMAALILSAPLVMFGVIGALVMLAAAIVIVVVSVMSLVNLYKSAQTLRHFRA